MKKLILTMVLCFMLTACSMHINPDGSKDVIVDPEYVHTLIDVLVQK